jgi:hypothetical protein
VPRKRIRVTIESHELTTIRRTKGPTEVWCEECRGRVWMVTAEEGAIMKAQSLRSLMRQVEAGGLHFAEDSTGRLFVCLNSLLQ